MVEKLKQVLGEFLRDSKPVWLFAVLKMDDITDKWSIVISAPWLSEQTNKQEFEYIVKILKKYLSEEELFTVARVGILKKTDHLVEELLLKKSGDKLKDERVNGNIIHEGEVIESNSDLNTNQD